MKSRDLFLMTFKSVTSQRQRSLLTSLGIAVGITAVVLLTAIGEGIHQFVLSEFTQFGTHIIGINPGKSETHGASMGIFGTTRPLTLEDAQALERLPEITAAVPVVQGNAEVKGNNRSRRTFVNAVGPDMDEAFQFQIASGRFLPRDDLNAPRAFAVLGSKLKEELFGSLNPLGERVRIGGERYRVIGVMAPKGQMLGFDLDDAIYIPAARGLSLFNRDSLIEIDVLYRPTANEDEVVASIRRLIEARHGRDDVTITTQQQMLEILGSILNVLTVAVGALGGISLLVGGIGILTIMTIAVSERTTEIGLLRAVGATRQQVLTVFLGEAIMLSTIGGLAGLGLGLGIAGLLKLGLPALPIETAWPFVGFSLALSFVIGLSAGALPAQRAARLDPIEALRAE